MGRFGVDGEGIVEVAVLVRRAGCELGGARAVVVPALGHAGVECALDWFGERWTAGWECARGDVGEFARRLDATAEAYRGTDEQVARLARRLGECLGPGGGPPGVGP